MSKQNITSLIGSIVAALVMTSCAALNNPEYDYLSGPILKYPTVLNTCTFGVQNMDENAKVESDALTCHYDGFDVTYKLSYNMVISLIIINKSNKSLIIDKSKSYVLYSGFSTQLFKDVRSTRSTTFNNVQDAIDNVQTNEGGVSMTIPPYSKWELPTNETNIREIKKLPSFKSSIGVHNMTPYDEQEVVEFIIPYSYDYSLAKWETCRNRVYVNSVEVSTGITSNRNFPMTASWISQNQYKIEKLSGEGPDYTEANRIDAINWKRWNDHKRARVVTNLLVGPITLGLGWWFELFGIAEVHSAPQTYGNGYYR